MSSLPVHAGASHLLAADAQALAAWLATVPALPAQPGGRVMSSSGWTPPPRPHTGGLV